jgi:hypothetical protein
MANSYSDIYSTDGTTDRIFEGANVYGRRLVTEELNKQVNDRYFQESISPNIIESFNT